MKHQDKNYKLGRFFLNQMTGVVIISRTLFFYMPSSVSGPPIRFWTIAWTNSLNGNRRCVCSIQSSAALGSVLIPFEILVYRNIILRPTKCFKKFIHYYYVFGTRGIC